MHLSAAKNELLLQLQKDILSLQGFRNTTNSPQTDTGLGPIEKSFPNKTFPIGAVHEFLSLLPEDAAATNGFITALLAKLMTRDARCLWISTQRMLFPPALKVLGIHPEHIIFIDLERKKEALWVVEEALKCAALAAVVGELNTLSFTESRRLQLAVEESSVTGFLHRYQPREVNNIACIARWQITSLPSVPEDGMPGVGYPRWNVQLHKIRNGKPGNWQVEWAADKFRHLPVTKPAFAFSSIRKAV